MQAPTHGSSNPYGPWDQPPATQPQYPNHHQQHHSHQHHQQDPLQLDHNLGLLAGFHQPQHQHQQLQQQQHHQQQHDLSPHHSPTYSTQQQTQTSFGPAFSNPGFTFENRAQFAGGGLGGVPPHQVQDLSMGVAPDDVSSQYAFPDHTQQQQAAVQAQQPYNPSTMFALPSTGLAPQGSVALPPNHQHTLSHHGFYSASTIDSTSPSASNVALASSGLMGASSAKRRRPDGVGVSFAGLGVGEDSEDEDGAYGGGPADVDVHVETVDEQKPKPLRACQRCKSLKVRCEFKTDPNRCKKCISGGHDCFIPGPKKRRPPPKREHLINQIREQAAKIDELMGSLEAANQRAASRKASATATASANANHLTPLTAFPDSGANGSSPTAVSAPKPKPDVAEWIAKAREAFHGLLVQQHPEDGTTTKVAVGMTAEQLGLVEDEFYSSDEDEYEYYYDDGDVEGGEGSEEVVATFGAMGVADDQEHNAFQARGATASPNPSANGHLHSGSPPPSSNPNRAPRKTSGTSKRTAAPALGTGESPLGIIARMSMRSNWAAAANKSSQSRGGSVDPDAGMEGVDGSPGDHLTTGSSPNAAGAPGETGVGAPGFFESRRLELEDEVGVDGDYDAGVPGSVRARSLGASGAGNASGGAGAGANVGVGDTAGAGTAGTEGNVAGVAVGSIILTEGLVSAEDVEMLFRIYFDNMNPSCSLLDPFLYTAQKTYIRSPFLFTVVCAIASRYFTDRQALYPSLMKHAKEIAGTTLISGQKSVDTVAAYILLSLYPVPMQRWEEDRTWLYLGTAIRFATDLNLHRPAALPSSSASTVAKLSNAELELREREVLNRTRIWINCFNLDRSTSSWHGKASTINNEDYVGSGTESWYRSSKWNLKGFDIHIAAYNAELRMLAEFRQTVYSDPSHPMGLNKRVDFEGLAAQKDEQFAELYKFWKERLDNECDPNDHVAQFRTSLIRLAYSYARLTVLSIGFQHAFRRSHGENPFFDRCLRAALGVVRVFTKELDFHKVYLRHGVEAQSIFVTFAAAFLIKLLHPKYASYLRREQRIEIRDEILALTVLLSSPEVVVDERHNPKLWARFLSGLLETPLTQVDLAPNLLLKNQQGHASGASSRRVPGGSGSTGKKGSAGTPSSNSNVGSGSSLGGTPTPGSEFGGGMRDAADVYMSGGTTSPPISSPTQIYSPQQIQNWQQQQQHHQQRQQLQQQQHQQQQYAQAQVQLQAQVQAQHQFAGFNTSTPTHAVNAASPGGGQGPASAEASPNALGIDLDFAPTTLGLSSDDFFQSVQSMEDPSIWEAMALSGPEWMQSASTTQMNRSINNAYMNTGYGTRGY